MKSNQTYVTLVARNRQLLAIKDRWRVTKCSPSCEVGLDIYTNWPNEPIKRERKFDSNLVPMSRRQISPLPSPPSFRFTSFWCLINVFSSICISSYFSFIMHLKILIYAKLTQLFCQSKYCSLFPFFLMLLLIFCLFFILSFYFFRYFSISAFSFIFCFSTCIFLSV